MLKSAEVTTVKPQHANGELCRAAAVLLVKPVRVGVGLSDLLEIRRLKGNSAAINKKLME